MPDDEPADKKDKPKCSGFLCSCLKEGRVMRVRSGMAGHEAQNRGAEITWLTPLHVINALGDFDLDPCGVPHWPTARRIISLPQDGFTEHWEGRVWLNPPYGSPEMWPWVAKLADHGSGVALIFARTETKGFVKHVWERADGIMFLHGRLRFHLPDGSKPDFKRNAGAPSCLVSYSSQDTEYLARSGLAGTLITDPFIAKPRKTAK